MLWNYETEMQGASERLAPILLTALVTALGLLPLATGSSVPRHEIEGSLAIVIFWRSRHLDRAEPFRPSLTCTEVQPVQAERTSHKSAIALQLVTITGR